MLEQYTNLGEGFDYYQLLTVSDQSVVGLCPADLDQDGDVDLWDSQPGSSSNCSCRLVPPVGDLNHDGKVDSTDLDLFKAAWQKADVNGDGIVNGNDLDSSLRRPKGVKREYLLGVLFFGGVWGLSEAVVGNALYAANVPHASVPLTAIGLMVLTVARGFFPRRGTATLIAMCAMLYKFLNSPFFGCHLLGILLTGACYDFVFDVLKIRLRVLAAAATTYLSYAGFALMITYLFRYNHWVQGGLAAVLRHVIVEGSLAAVVGACLVPASARLGQKLKAYSVHFEVRNSRWEGAEFSALTLGLWAFAVVMCVLSYPRIPS